MRAITIEQSIAASLTLTMTPARWKPAMPRTLLVLYVLWCAHGKSTWPVRTMKDLIARVTMLVSKKAWFKNSMGFTIVKRRKV
jgi:hypothetical protein